MKEGERIMGMEIRPVYAGESTPIISEGEWTGAMEKQNRLDEDRSRR